MAGTVLETIDAQLDDLFRSWNWLSTILAATLIIYLLYPLLVSEEPETHPLLLSRQANISQIRHANESAIYRSLETAHGYPLKGGLNVKESGAAKWATGRDGDLRDIWRRAVQGSETANGMQMGEVGKLHTVLGMAQVIDHDMTGISKEINIIGKHVKQQNAISVAVYLPNSVELLTVVFGASPSRTTMQYANLDSCCLLWVYSRPDTLWSTRRHCSPTSANRERGFSDRFCWFCAIRRGQAAL